MPTKKKGHRDTTLVALLAVVAAPAAAPAAVGFASGFDPDASWVEGA